MTRHQTRWCITGSWLSLVVLAFLIIGVSSAWGVLLLMVFGLVPPIVVMALWHDPPQTIAQVLNAADQRR